MSKLSHSTLYSVWEHRSGERKMTFDGSPSPGIGWLLINENLFVQDARDFVYGPEPEWSGEEP